MEIDKTIVLSNGVEMPRLIQGVPHCDQWTNYSVDFFYDILRTSVRNGIVAFDSSHAYGKSESTIGYVLLRREYHERKSLLLQKLIIISSMSGI